MSVEIDLAERIKLIAARINEGRDTYAGRLDAWHSLGDANGKFRTLDEITIAAKAAFRVLKFQLDFNGKPVDAYGTFRLDTAIPKGLENKAIKFELGTGEEVYLTFLGHVGKDYQVIHHTSMGSILDHLVGQVDGAHYETMGVLDFGRVVWAQVNPNFQIRVGEDISDIYLSYRTSHDGSLAACIYETATRQVCKNTVRIGFLKRLSSTLRVRHTKGAEARIKDMTAEIDEIKSVAMTMQDRLLYLSTKKVTKESLTTIFTRLFPPTKNDDGVEESSVRRDNMLAGILERYENNDGNAFPEQRGTSLNLLNAIVEHTDHFRSSKANGRAESAVFGSGDKLKTSALDLIIAESEGMPLMPTRGAAVNVEWEELGLNIRKN